MTQTLVTLAVFTVALGLLGYLVLRMLRVILSQTTANSTAQAELIGKIARDLLVPQTDEAGKVQQPDKVPTENVFELPFEQFDDDAARFLIARAKQMEADKFSSPLAPANGSAPASAEVPEEEMGK